jgi:ATP-binding protein involved in chromosome partitioning
MSSAASLPTLDQVREALARVNDPEIRRPITELGMVRDVIVRDDGRVGVTVDLTTPGCPLKETITRDVTREVGRVPGNQPVVWRGPMLHRALQQFLSDVFWGDLDVLLLDLPPGTGDIAISVAQLIPGAEILVVTTPQRAAAEVAERAGAIALQTHQQVVGVVENMSWLEQPDGSRVELFGQGGGQAVAESLTRSVGAPVPLLGQVPIDVSLREGGDAGTPVVLADPDSAAAVALRGIARGLSRRARGLAGRSLGLTPTRR